MNTREGPIMQTMCSACLLILFNNLNYDKFRKFLFYHSVPTTSAKRNTRYYTSSGQRTKIYKGFGSREVYGNGGRWTEDGCLILFLNGLVDSNYKYKYSVGMQRSHFDVATRGEMDRLHSIVKCISSLFNILLGKFR